MFLFMCINYEHMTSQILLAIQFPVRYSTCYLLEHSLEKHRLPSSLDVLSTVHMTHISALYTCIGFLKFRHDIDSCEIYKYQIFKVESL